MCKWKPYSSQGSHESQMNKGPERTPSDARGQASFPPPPAAHREQGGPRTVTKWAAVQVQHMPLNAGATLDLGKQVISDSPHPIHRHFLGTQ